MITILDYGLGNVRAFLNAYKLLNVDAKPARTAAELEDATKIVLPGVGAFDQAMELLEASGMKETLEELAVERRVPVLGVCVGMQILAGSSDEGVRAGLGWVRGRVRHLSTLDTAGDLRLPHMGWNDVRATGPSPLFDNLDNGARFYFLHSFYFEVEVSAQVVGVADYGAEFSCAVAANNIFGVQFHPEKSHHFGLRLLHNFARL